MPTYYFNLKTHQGRDIDVDGTILINDVQAKEYGVQIALELMRCREVETRPWRLEICDANRRPIVDLLFARVDPSLADLRPESRSIVQQASAHAAALIDAILDARNSYYELKATLLKFEGKPHLASLEGNVLPTSISREADSGNSS
jgi:hypothetical protein